MKKTLPIQILLGAMAVTFTAHANDFDNDVFDEIEDIFLEQANTNNQALLISETGTGFANMNADADLYLVLGQSNAAGRDTNFDHDGADEPDPDVLLFTDGNSFEIASQPLNRYSDVRKTNIPQGVSLGLEFGIKMHAKTGRKTHLVVNARGGTRVAQWLEKNEYFGPTVQRVKDAEAACNCKLKGIVWHQGEGNTRSTELGYTTSYFTTLVNLFGELRTYLGDVPIIVGEVARNSDNANFNRALREVDDSDFPALDLEWASSANLDTIDGTHFDARSSRKLGKRYAKRMQQFVD